MDTTLAVGAGLAIGLAALGCGIGQGICANGALNGMARQPEVQNRLFSTMLIALAFVESLTIFSFLISIQLAGHIH